LKAKDIAIERADLDLGMRFNDIDLVLEVDRTVTVNLKLLGV